MPLTEVKSNKTYTDLYGDHFNNVVVFGDDSAPNKFMAHVKMEFWGENWIALGEEGIGGNPAVSIIQVNGHDESLLSLDTPTVRHQWFRDAKDLTGKCAHTLKWLRILKSKPATNKYAFKMTGDGWREFNFLYQMPLAVIFPNSQIDYLMEDGVECIRATHPDGNYDQRPVEIEGSYAVYHNYKRDYCAGGKNYRTGKVLHIPRPKATDAVGKTAWVELDIRDGIYTATIPQDFLDAAIYPVTINDKLGYWSSGASYGTSSPDYQSYFGPFQASSSGSAQTVSAYVRAVSSNCPMTLGFWNNNGGVPGTLVEDCSEISVPVAAAAWNTGTLHSNPSIDSSSWYWIGYNRSGTGTLRHYYDTSSSFYFYAETKTYNAGVLVNATSPVLQSTRVHSIYVYYTVAANLEASAFDNISLTDSASVELTNYDIGVDDDIGLQDEPAIEIAGGNLDVSAYDLVNTTDDVKYELSFYEINVFESIGGGVTPLSDWASAEIVSPLDVSAFDLISATDFPIVEVSVWESTAFDSVAASDSGEVVISLYEIAAYDGIGLSDQPEEIISPFEIYSDNDIGLQDYGEASIVSAETLAPSAYDNIGILDGITVFINPFEIVGMDSVGISDDVSALLNIYRIGVEDLVDISDYANLARTGLGAPMIGDRYRRKGVPSIR